MSKEGNGFSKHESFYRRHSTALTIHIPLFLFNVLLTIVILLVDEQFGQESGV